uniref:Putative secreted protein n=1 Tax=Amblyomma triste TaxID=251400 RepID=A0A023G1B6_AMBTT
MGDLIVDSIMTPFSWYSLLPIIGFSIFLFLAVAYQRTEFYWITDKVQDVYRSLAARYSKNPQHSPESHVPWFIAGTSAPTHGMAMSMFQRQSPTGYPEEVGGAPSDAVLLNTAASQMDTPHQTVPLQGDAGDSGGNVHSASPIPALTKVSDMDEWNATV